MIILYNVSDSNDEKIIPEVETTNLSDLSDTLSDILDNQDILDNESDVLDNETPSTSSGSEFSLAEFSSYDDSDSVVTLVDSSDSEVSIATEIYHHNEVTVTTDDSDGESCYAYPLETREEVQKRYEKLRGGRGINGMILQARKFFSHFCMAHQEKSKRL